MGKAACNIRSSCSTLSVRFAIINPPTSYLANLGPTFETPAEVRAATVLGADVVGMSTVPEVVSARHCGLKVAAVGIVVNLASGLSASHITHDETLHFAGLAAEKLTKLIGAFLDSWGSTK